MRSFAVVASFVAAANAYAYNYTTPAAPVYVTTVVSEYTTVCAGPTEIPVGPSSTITVTEATTLTVTDCPCTVTYPAESTPAYTPPAYTPVAPPASSPAPYYPSGNGSAPVVPTGTTAPTTPAGTSTPSPSEFPGAAGKAGLSLLAVAGALAAFL